VFLLGGTRIVASVDFFFLELMSGGATRARTGMYRASGVNGWKGTNMQENEKDGGCL
jgi:hypothetical protein